MREAVFLRTPIRPDHQGRLQNLTVAEQPLSGNPDPANAYPPTLILKFDVDVTSWLCSTVMSESWTSIVDSNPSSELPDEL